MEKDKPLRLFVADGTGFVPAPDAVLIRAAAAAVIRALNRGPSFASPAAARRLLPSLLGTLRHEVFCVAHLDKRHRLIHFEELFRGTIDGASVHPREIVRSVIEHNSAGVVLVHNHPSGSAESSQADELITTRVKEALALIDVRVLDHFIIGDGQCFSFCEAGLL